VARYGDRRWSCHDDPVSIDFDPVKVGPRRRRIDPVRVLIVVAVVGLAFAIVKPWAFSTTEEDPVPSTALGSPSPTGSPLPTPDAGVRTTGTTDSTVIRAPTWPELTAVIKPHDRLGVRAIVVARRQSVGSPASPRFQERWARATKDIDGMDAAFVAHDEQAIVALGLTAPLDAAPLDVRIWRLHADDEVEWIDIRPLDANDRVGALTFTHAGAAASTTPAWAPGHYRLDVLAADGIHRLAVDIPGRFGSVPAPDEWTPAQANLVGPDESDPSGVQLGPFATVDGIGLSLAASERELMSDEEAWRTVIEDGPTDVISPVASVFLPRATGLGVMLTTHADVSLATVRRIAPDARFRASPMVGGISELRGRTPWVAFAPRGGGVWPPGVYAITVHWNDGAGFHAETWHVEMRPGPIRDRNVAG
jgi:hypothetical protein